MAQYIALLRGINVSGQKKIKMIELKKLFEDLSFTNVETYIQSGNVLFSSKSINSKSMKDTIEKRIALDFGFQVQSILKTPAELGKTLKKNPFLKNKDIARVYYTFLSAKPSAANIKKLSDTDYSPEEYVINGDVVFLFFPAGYGKAKLNNNFFEKKLGVYATTRNHKTVETLFEMAGSN